MERKQLIGLVLISCMLFVYNLLFTPKPNSENNQSIDKETTINELASKKIDEFKISDADNINYQHFDIINHDTHIEISAQGGYIADVKFTNKSFNNNSNSLIDTSTSKIKYKIHLNDGSVVDLSNKTFELITNDGETLVMSTNISDNEIVKITYSIPKSGYKIYNRISYLKDGLESEYKFLSVDWVDNLKPMEPNISICRSNTTVNFCGNDVGFDNLNDNSSNVDDDSSKKNLTWFSFKQRFFSSAIISEECNMNAILTIKNPEEENTAVVKQCKAYATIAPKEKNASFSFYFGPNDYYILKSTAKDFSKNITLGWGPIRLLNEIVILPIFKLMSLEIANIGIIILLVVLLIKLLLLPLSYRSYIATVKMKLLKPEIDQIKAKNKDNLQAANIEQMQLYKQYGVNPLSSFGLLLLQIPILLAAFKFIPNELTFRAKELWWATDMSNFDSIFTLPFAIPAYGSHVSLFTILMTLSTFLHTYTNPEISSQDSKMKIISYTMPIVFMFVLNKFPAALSLYYLISNIVTIVIQFVIKKLVSEEKIRAKLELNKTLLKNKTSTFTKRLEEMMNTPKKSN